MVSEIEVAWGGLTFHPVLVFFREQAEGRRFLLTEAVPIIKVGEEAGFIDPLTVNTIQFLGGT